jgi:4-hydroxythreonine-4-phosphate dehydrogenase
LGNQEKQIIIPAIKKLKIKKYNIADFFSNDVAWAKMLSNNYDLIVCMYHDQVMTPLKIINKDKIVNLTAGLPFIRTSPGHGTAFDIAGKNKADATSMIEAILTAVRFSKK